MHDVFLAYQRNAVYPADVPYNPDMVYPEYLFKNNISHNTRNFIYSLVRECLSGMRLDEENFNTTKWNPLGAYIEPGHTVLIKPNWVNNENGYNSSEDDSLDCLITHPACVRAICDYCLIALKGKGKVIIADAPIQDCDIDLLWKKSHYAELLTFYQKHNQNVEFADLRTFMRVTNKLAVRTHKALKDGKCVYVAMNHKTAFADLPKNTKYSVPNYDPDKTTEFHTDRHIYGMSKLVLDSDVVINVCKPKCHRYAGITAALKNAVGMIAEKETLPHRRPGPIQEGGDSFSAKSHSKGFVDKVLYLQTKYEDRHQIWRADLCRILYGFLFYYIKGSNQDNSLKGCWHGNDTIWRTILDINYILKFSDKSGNLKETPQRKLLNFADMIIAGQHNGPLSPEPKPIGAILFSEEASQLDLVVCKMMNFDYNKIPLLRHIMHNNNFYECQLFKVISNNVEFCGEYDSIVFPQTWRFIPHDAWDGIL